MAQMSVDQNLAQIEAVVYDVEIISAIPDVGKVRDPDLFYCGGWEDYEGMGVSVVTAYDFVESSWNVYLQDNLHQFKTLVNSRRTLIGFNNERFDNNVLRANGFLIPPEKSWDNWKAVVDTQPQGQRKGFSLNDLLVANGLQGKTGLGSEAPRLAQTGKWGELINYCLSDTARQLKILRLTCSNMLKNPKNGEYMEIKPPWDKIKVDKDALF